MHALCIIRTVHALLDSSSTVNVWVNVLKFQTPFSFCSHIRAGIHKILVRLANREDPDQTASPEAV